MKRFSASYDTRFVAAVDASGALHIAEITDGNVRDEIRIPPKAAKSIIADLEDADDMHGYGEDEINAVQHWILAGAYRKAPH